jgi:hypothetical protein
VLVLGAVVAVGAVTFFNARDDATVPQGAGASPGRAVLPARDDPAWQRDAGTLAAGNVIVRYGDQADRAPLVALADEVAGPPSKALVSSGQAVIIRRDPSQAGVLARAYAHQLLTRSPRDPRLRLFVEARLGRAAAG